MHAEFMIGAASMRKASVLYFFIGLNLAFGPAQAEKTAVIPCTRTSDGTIVHEEADVQDRARQFAISDPRFYRVDQFRRANGPDDNGKTKGTCIIDFMSEDEFQIQKK